MKPGDLIEICPGARFFSSATRVPYKGHHIDTPSWGVVLDVSVGTEITRPDLIQILAGDKIAWVYSFDLAAVE